MIRNKDDYKRYIKIEKDNYHYSYPNLTKELKKIIKFQKLYRKLEYYTNCKKSFIIKNILIINMIIYLPNMDFIYQ